MRFARGVIAMVAALSLCDGARSVPSAAVPPWRIDPFPSTYHPLPRSDFLLTNATILDGAGRRIDHGDLLVRDGATPSRPDLGAIPTIELTGAQLTGA